MDIFEISLILIVWSSSFWICKNFESACRVGVPWYVVYLCQVIHCEDSPQVPHVEADLRNSTLNPPESNIVDGKEGQPRRGTNG